MRAQLLYVRFCVQFGFATSLASTYHTFAVYNNTYYGYVLYVCTSKPKTTLAGNRKI